MAQAPEADTTVKGYPEVPESVAYGNDIEGAATIDPFFDSILDFMGYDERAREISVRREYRFLHQESYNEKCRDTDDIIDYLIVQNRIVASVIRWRDAFNYTQMAYACYLNDHMMELLRCPEPGEEPSVESDDEFRH